MELSTSAALTHLLSVSRQPSSSARLPRPTRSPIARSRGFHRASGTTQAVRLLTRHRFPFRLRLLVHLARCHPQTVSVLLRSRVVLPYRAVRKHLGSVGE